MVKDAEVLVNKHSEKLIYEELQNIQLEMHQRTDEAVDLDEKEETRENMPSSEIKNIFSMWNKGHGFFGKRFSLRHCCCNPSVCKLFK